MMVAPSGASLIAICSICQLVTLPSHAFSVPPASWLLSEISPGMNRFAIYCSEFPAYLAKGWLRVTAPLKEEAVMR
ncbi:MAG: hypothetical protein J6S49_10105, partial [Erysipelotrichaceae bacterium]|nr:hypothetical protein [Erysipelotrichaceae bacterium]